jgi:cytochrome c oxidase subunit 3
MPDLDVSALPTTGFGHRSTAWWGTIGFMVAEGTTLAIGGWAYFYLFRRFEDWPPAGTSLPSLVVPTVGLALLLLMIPVMRRASARAREMNVRATVRWLWLAALMSASIAVLRAVELQGIGVRWDDHAYGSILWLLLGFHGSLVFVDILETAGLATVLRSDRRLSSHFADVEDATLYEYFLSLVWIPIYVLVYILPRT